MPAELGLFAFGGGILLLIAVFQMRSHAKLIGWGFGTALITIVGGQALAVVTGLADGSTEVGGWQWMLVLGSLVVYTLSVVSVGLDGILVLRDLFNHDSQQHNVTISSPREHTLLASQQAWFYHRKED